MTFKCCPTSDAKPEMHRREMSEREDTQWWYERRLGDMWSMMLLLS